MLQNMEDAGVIPGKCLKSGRKQFVFAAVIEPCEKGAGLYVLHLYKSAFELLTLADPGYFKSV